MSIFTGHASVQAPQSDDVGRIRKAMEALQQAAMAIGQGMYGQQPGAGAPGADSAGAGAGGYAGGPAASGSGRGDEEVVEGEFHEV